MLAILVDRPFEKPGWIYEEKYDDYRILAYKDNLGSSAAVQMHGLLLVSKFIRCPPEEFGPGLLTKRDRYQQPDRTVEWRWKMKTVEATWKPHEKHGQLTMQSDLPDTVFAFPKQRKEPLTDARQVRNAVARFDQVIDVSDEDRALAFANIERAAQYYNVNLSETNWHELGAHPQHHREEAAAKAVETKRERGELEKAAAKAVKTKREHGVLQEEAAKAAATRRREREAS